MSSIRLSGSSSGYYDLTVPAAAGTNSIDLSKLPVLAANNKLGIGTTSPTSDLHIQRTGSNASITIEETSATNYSQYVELKDNTTSWYMANRYAITGAGNSGFGIGTTSSGDMFQIDTSGYVRKPYQPCFDVASNQSVGQNSYQTFNTQYHNVGNHFSLANNRFTAPVDGLYQFFATTIKNTANTGGVARVYIYVNGSVANGSRHVRLSEGANYGSNGVGSWIISMSAGDYAQVYMGSGGNGSHSSTEYTYFNGYLLG